MFFNCRAKWVTIAGQKYQPMCIVILGVNEDYPVFGQVQELYMIDTTKPIMAIVTVMPTLTFNVHYHGNILGYCTSSKAISLKKLHSPFPLHARRCPNGDKLVVMKHHISGTLLSSNILSSMNCIDCYRC